MIRGMKTYHQTMPTDSSTLDTIAEEVDDLLNKGCDCSEIEFLARSVNRLGILIQLAKTSQSRAALQAKLDIPQTTLRRNLVQLAEKQWIEERPSENVYQILPPGEIIIKSFHELLQNVDTADSLASFIEYYPGSISLDTETLTNCKVTCCQEGNPYSPVMNFDTILKETDIFHVALPVINPAYADTIKNRILDDCEQEIVIPTEVLEMLQSEYSSVLTAFDETETAQLFVSEETPTLGIGLMDARVTVLTYGQNQQIHSLLKCDCDQQTIVDWAEQRYHSYKRTADIYA
jgi:predicted transcriptional regulator